MLRVAGIPAEQGMVEMTEPGAVLEAVQVAIADLAVVLVAVRSGFGGECGRAERQLEMGEMDLLSARDAVEKARLEIDVAGAAVAAVRVAVPISVGSVAGRGAAPHRVGVTAAADVESRVPGRHRAGTRRRGFPCPGQGELFSVRDATSLAAQLI